MFKNSKILKGITLVLALVFVLGIGILVSSYVDAASKTVLFYVSDHGDNSTGEDEATAFTSIDAAIAAANNMYLEAGSQLKLLVVDRVSVPTQEVDAQILTDRTGARVPIIITSYQNVTDKEDFSEVYFTYFTEDPKIPESSQKAIFFNDITFKNIRLNAQAQDVFSDKGDSAGYYCVRRMYINSEKFTLDNVELTNEDSLKKAKWNIYCGGSAATQAYLNKEINFLNGDYYSKTSVTHVTNGDSPNTNYVFNVENAKLNYVYVMDNNANQVTVNYKNGADVYAQYYGTGKTITVPGDVTINYEKGSLLRNAWGSDGGAEYNFNLIQNVYGKLASATNFGPAGDINGDMITNFYEGCDVKGSFTYGSYGGVTGTMLTNVYGGTFNDTFIAGKSSKTSTSGMSNHINRIVTNIEGGTFAKTASLAPNVDGITVGDVVATVGKATFNAELYGTGCSRIQNDFQFYINGATIKGDLRCVNGSASAKRGIGGDAYVKITSMSMPTSGKMFRGYQNMGTIEGNSTVIFDTTDDPSNSINIVGSVNLCFSDASQSKNDCLVYIDGGANSRSITFGGAFNGGSAQKRVINNVKNCTFKDVYVGMRDTGTEYLENSFENVTFEKAYYGSVSNDGIGGTYGAIVNSFKNCELKNTYYGAGGGSAAKYVGSVTNIFENTTTSGILYMGGNGTSKYAISGDITNYFKDSTFASETHCGSANGDVKGNIKNTFIGGSQGNTFYGGNASGGTVTGSITNIFDSVQMKKSTVAGSRAGTVSGDIATTFTNCDCLTGGSINGAVSSGVGFTGAISIAFNGGTYAGDIIVSNNIPKIKSLDITFNGGTFSGNFAGIWGPYTVENDMNFTMTSAIWNASSSSYFRILRPSGTSVVKGDLNIVLDTTSNPSNAITGTNLLVEVSWGDSVVEGEANLYVDGGENRAINIRGIYGGLSQVKATNTVKNATLKIFAGSRNNGSSATQKQVVNNFENVTITQYYSGTSSDNTSLKSFIAETVTNNLKNVVLKAPAYFRGGSNSGESSQIPKIVNNIENCVFEGTFEATGRGTTGEVQTNVYGAEFKAAAYTSRSAANSTSVTFTLEPKAGAVSFAVNPATSAKDAIVLRGATHPIMLKGDSALTFTEYDGAAQRFVQSASWTADQTYVTFPANAELSAITVFNASSSVTGNGVIDGNVIKGAAAVATAPTPQSVSFHLGDALMVRFWMKTSEVEAWINANGSWSYSIDFMGKILQSATFTSMDQFAAADFRSNGEYVTFLANLEITSIRYGEKITVALSGGVSNDYTVYKILDLGVSYYETLDPQFATLLMAIYNYGAEAYNVVCDGNEEVKYASKVPAPQNYTGSASATGNAFYATGISLDEKVTLNFYLNVANLDQLSFVASNSKGALLPASAIKVRAVAGVAEYNAMVSLKLTIPQMAEVYTLSVQNGGATVATCTNSVAYSCMTYINPQGSTPVIYAPVAKALLAFIEASLPVVNR